MAAEQLKRTRSSLNKPIGMRVNEWKSSSSALQRVLAAPEGDGPTVAAPRSGERNGAVDPFYIHELGVMVDLWQKWQGALPRVQPFYAVKCNPDPALLSALGTLGAGFDCASRAEIEAILKLGLSPDPIVYANPCKAETQLKYAANVGVNLTTFDSVEEVEKIMKFHPRCALLLRVKVPEEDAGGARCPLGPKYGALPEEVGPLLQAAQSSGLAVAGVSFHVGSGVARSRVYAGAVGAVRGIFDTASRLGLPQLRILNIGGGFTAGPTFTEAAGTVRTALKTYFPDETEVSVIAEPGRYFAESAFTLATNVIGKRVRGELREYWINDGIYGSMNCLLYDHAVITSLTEVINNKWLNRSCRRASRLLSLFIPPNT